LYCNLVVKRFCHLSQLIPNKNKPLVPRLVISLATQIDDIVLEAVKKVIAMVRKVTEAFTNLPDVITEGISDMMEAGKADDDPDPVDVEPDVQDLDKQRAVIEEASVLQTVRVSSDGLDKGEEKINKTRDMIKQSRGFAESCQKNIDDFMGVWDLRAATVKLVEMCRLVKLGDLLTQFAEQIRRLVKAVVSIFEAVREKFRNMDLLPDRVEEAVEEVVDDCSQYCGCVLQ